MAAQNPNPAKLYTLEFEERPNYLYAFVKGDRDSYEISKSYWKQVGDECRRVECNRVLIEEDIRDEMSQTEMYRFTSELAVIGFAGIRVAFVDRQLSQRELNKFGELVATNRGLMAKVFDAVEEAEQWLVSG